MAKPDDDRRADVPMDPLTVASEARGFRNRGLGGAELRAGGWSARVASCGAPGDASPR